MRASTEMGLWGSGASEAGGSGQARWRGDRGGARSLQAVAQLSLGHLQASQTREELGLLRHQGWPEGPPGQLRTPLGEQPHTETGRACAGSLAFSPHRLPLSPAE